MENLKDKTIIGLVNTWCRSVSVMHKAHHIAASKLARRHRLLGGSAAILAAVVGTSIFVSATESNQSVNQLVVILLGLVSMLSAGLSAAVIFLNYDDRSSRHLQAAADFQRLRREMEEELVRIENGKGRDNYDAFKDQWHDVLKSVPPLPQAIHDDVNKKYEEKYMEK